MATSTSELNLKETTERLAFAIQSAGMCAWEVDVAGDAVAASPEMLRLWGLDPETFDGARARLQEKVHAADREVMRLAIQDAVSNGGVYECEYRIYPEPNVERWVFSRGRCTYDPLTKRVLKLSGVVSDVTDRRRDAERMKALFDLSGSGACELDPESLKFLKVNQTFADLFEYSVAELMNRTLFDLMRPTEVDAAKNRYQAVLQSESSSWRQERCFLSKSGREIWVISNGFIHRDSLNRPIEVLKTVFDVSDLKRTQFELERAIETRDHFLSLASHELKTPLTTLKLQVELRQRELQKGLPQALDPQSLARSLKQQKSSIDKLSTLIDRVLDASMTSQGKMNYQFASTDLSQSLIETVEAFRVHAPDQVFEVVCNDIVQAEVDAVRIEQAFLNLLSNALKYGAGKPIRIELKRVGAAACLIVSDQGIGIAEPDQSRIFERFERAVSANEIAGLGVGLYVVKEIAVAHGGSVTVNSSVGIGSTFTLTLPVAKRFEERGRV